jgi:hypothetical protein
LMLRTLLQVNLVVTRQCWEPVTCASQDTHCCAQVHAWLAIRQQQANSWNSSSYERGDH